MTNKSATTETGQRLLIQGVTKQFDGVEVLRNTDIDIAAGEFMTLLGPSGSGKSTLLNIIAGYLDPSSGSITLGERDVTRTPARHRHIGMVFQNYALFPHMTVRQNVAYGPTVQKFPKVLLEQSVRDALQTVQMEAFADRPIQALSGGQRQRVALARAIAVQPDVILMDEPLGALDRQLRKAVQLEIRRLHEAHGRTTIYVTHDQEEALVMSDRIAIMRDGVIVQIGTPQELYLHPNSAFIATFLGESNIIDGTIGEVRGPEASLHVPALGLDFNARCADGLNPGDTAALVVRPEHVTTHATTGWFKAQVSETVFLGEIMALRLTAENGSELWSRSIGGNSAKLGDVVYLDWQASCAQIIPTDNPKEKSDG